MKWRRALLRPPGNVLAFLSAMLILAWLSWTIGRLR
jgi:hypothetical protein